VIDLVPVRALDSGARKSFANSQSKIQQAIDIAEFQLLAMFVHEKKPVSAPGNIASNRPNARNFDRDIRGETVTRNIRHFHCSILIEMRDDNADGRLDPV
jgi:hypothetical protein